MLRPVGASHVASMDIGRLTLLMSQAGGASRPTLERSVGRRDVSSVRVFVAGGSGVVGMRLLPQLTARGHHVTATTTGPGKLGLLGDLGAHGVVLDGLDGASVGEAVAIAKPDAIVHVMTALSSAHAGAPNVRHMDQWFGPTTHRQVAGADPGRGRAGDGMTEGRGFSNSKAKSELGWTPDYRSWRQGFKEGLQ